MVLNNRTIYIMSLVRCSMTKNMGYQFRVFNKKLLHKFFVNSRKLSILGKFNLIGRPFNSKYFVYRRIDLCGTENRHVRRYNKKFRVNSLRRKYTNPSNYLSNYLNFLLTVGVGRPKTKLRRYISSSENYKRNKPYLFINTRVTNNGRNNNNMFITVNTLKKNRLLRRKAFKFRRLRRKYRVWYLDDSYAYFWAHRRKKTLYNLYSSLKYLGTGSDASFGLPPINSLYYVVGPTNDVFKLLGNGNLFVRNISRLLPTPVYGINNPIQIKRVRNFKFIRKYLVNLPKLVSILTNYQFKSKYSFRKRKVTFTGTKKPFIFMNTGFILTQKTNNTLKFFAYKSRFKKILYSFIQPNQYKKSIFMSKKKIIISRFVYKKKLRSIRQFNFSFKLFKKKIKFFFLSKKYNMSNLNNYFNGSRPHDMYTYSRTQQNIIYKNELYSKGLDNSDKLKEVFIPRVRFKPGYQRIWRVARRSLKELLGLNYMYQHRLTSYLSRFLRFDGNYFYSFSDMNVDKVVMYSKLLPDIKTLHVFISKCMVYVNGLRADSFRVMYVNDIVQIVVSKWYYVFYRWLSNWTVLRVRKFKRLVYRKGLANRHRLMKTRKVKSRYTPNWIINSKFDSSDIKNHLEVDYFTLSSIIIYEPYILDHHHFMEPYENKIGIYRMYNWKYIT